jgi:hypothetical protein
MDRTDLDDRLDQELAALPQPRAPRTLLPRVLAATAAAEARGGATGWFTWPLGWRIASVAMLVALVTGGSLFATAPPQHISDAAETAGEVATVARVLWDVLAQPLATYLFVLGVSLALACALAWAALEAALGGASQR